MGGFECEAEEAGVRYELLVKYQVERHRTFKVWLVIRHFDNGECITTLKRWP